MASERQRTTVKVGWMTAIRWWVLVLGVCLAPSAAWASEAMPLAARMTVFRAQQVLAKGDTPRAMAILEHYKDTHNDRPAPFMVDFLLGNCHAMAGRPADAVVCYESAAVQKKNDPSLWQNLARCYFELERFSEAAAAFARLYGLVGSKNPEWLYDAGVCHLMDNRPEKALALFEQLMAAHPQSLTLAWKASVVHAYLGCNQSRKALPLVRELAAGHTGDQRRRWQEVLLHQYLQLEMPAEALALVQRLVEEDSLEPRWWKGLAHLQLERGRHRESLTALTVYSLLTPLTDDEMRLLADLQASVELPGPAAEAYAALAVKNPDAGIVERLVQLYRRLGEPQKALAWIDSKALSQKPLEQLRLRGAVLFDLQRWEAAAEAYQTLLDRRPEEGRAWLMLGYASWNQGDITGARKALQRAANHQQTRKAANQALKQLPSPDPS